MNVETSKLFTRYSANPILFAQMWPYEVNSVFNPGATLLSNGETLLLVRCEDFRGFSHLSIARSKDGISNWKIDKIPVVAPFTRYKEGDSILPKHESERWGAEDPRITYIKELNEYIISYTAYSGSGPEVSLIRTSDFNNYKRIGPIFPPDNKDAALFPEKVDGKWLILHRPTYGKEAHIWLSSTKDNDLDKWSNHQIMLKARKGGWWDALKIGLGPPPLKTDEGWLILYHGVRQTASGKIYRVGAALFDLENPLKIIARGDDWILGPEESYEREGDVDDVVFPTGWVIDPKTEKLRIYYGAADTCIGLVTADVKEILNTLLTDK